MDEQVMVSDELGPMAPKACKKCHLWSDMKQRLRIAELLETMVDKFQKKLAEDEYKPSVAEYLKLVQMEQEFEKDIDGPKEMTVTWVDPKPTCENSK